MEKIDDFYMEGIPDNEQNTLITVIVACYNVEKYVARCIESIMSQTYKNLEILLIDDGARDNTGAICDHYATLDSRITVVHQNNCGLAMARNEGISRAHGEYIAFVDADDFLEDRMYEYMLYAIRKTGAELAVSRYFEDDEDSLSKVESYEKKGLIHIKESEQKKSVVESGVKLCIMDSGEALEAYVEEREDIVIRNAAWNKLYKRDKLSKESFPCQRYYEDIVFQAKMIASVPKVVYIDTPLYHYIINRKGGIMSGGLRKEIFTEQIPAYHERSDFLKSLGRDDLSASHDYLVYKKLLLLYTEAKRDKSGEKKKFLEPLEKEIRTCADQMYRIFSCNISNPHQKMRMDLFLKHPKLYDIFMDLNDNFVLPIRQRNRGKNNK